MELREITEKQKVLYNKLVTHVIQSWEWGEFRKSMGLKVARYGLFKKNVLKTTFQVTFHKIPLINKYIGYLPKGPYPNSELAEALKKIGKENNCVFIKLEPDISIDNGLTLTQSGLKMSETLFARSAQIDNSFRKSPKSLFTKYNFVLDLTKSEEELLKNMHPKTRYNIKVAQKHAVKVEERVDDKGFKIYLELYFETTKRQGYHGHNKYYHQQVWNELKRTNAARLLIAFYQKQPLTAWMLFSFKDNLYYPYGGSSKSHPEVMANNLIAWEAIKLGKKLGLKKFDMWGALGPDADPKDPWFGFHKFKMGYGGRLVEYIGTFDLIFDWPIYLLFTAIDRLTPLKVFLLKLLGK